VLQAVASGYGVAFVSELSVQHWNRAEGLCRIIVNGFAVDRKIWMAQLKGRVLSPAAKVFANLLKNSDRK